MSLGGQRAVEDALRSSLNDRRKNDPLSSLPTDPKEFLQAPQSERRKQAMQAAEAAMAPPQIPLVWGTNPGREARAARLEQTNADASRVAVATKMSERQERAATQPPVELSENTKEYMEHLVTAYETQAPWPTQTAAELMSSMEEDNPAMNDYSRLEDTVTAIEGYMDAKNPPADDFEGDESLGATLDGMSARSLVNETREILQAEEDQRVLRNDAASQQMGGREGNYQKRTATLPPHLRPGFSGR